MKLGTWSRVLVVWVVLSVALVAGCGEHVPNRPSSTGEAAQAPDAADQRITLSNTDAYDALLALPGVVGVGTTFDGAGRAQLVAMVERATVALPARFSGVTVTRLVTGEFRPFALTGTYRPAPIGVSVGNANECLPGTIGCVLDIGARKYLLSANHVFARQNQATLGESIVQPSRPDADAACGAPPASLVIAHLSDFQTIVYDGRTPNTMDAAIAEVASPSSVSCATPAAFYGFPSATVAAPATRLPIMKVGRTTELTRGEIKAIDVRVKIKFPSGTAVFDEQMLTSRAFGDFGDSGSLVVTDDGTKRPVGIVIGGTNNGTAIVTPIAPILARFNATICTE
jgi:hypothetical protein